MIDKEVFDCNKLKVYNILGDNFENRRSNNGEWFVQENENRQINAKI